MRDYKGMKRQRGRNRNVGGGGGQPQGGGKPGQNANRAFDSNGPDNIKVRGHAQHVYEKYNQLARDATSAGDRVLAENHLQHAEHYFRTLRVLQPNRPVTEIVGRDTFAGGFDLDFEDETLETAMAEADAAAAAQPVVQAQPQPETGDAQADRPQGERYDRQDRQQPGDGQRREFRDRPFQERGDRAKFDGPRRERWEDRGDRSQGERSQGERSQTDRAQSDRAPADRQPVERAPGERFQAERSQNDRSQNDRVQGDRAQPERGERPRYEPRRDRWEEREPAAEVEAPSADGHMLRSEDGGVSHAPAFLAGPSTAAPAAPAPSEEGEARRPRTRRPRRRAEEGTETQPTDPAGDEG